MNSKFYFLFLLAVGLMLGTHTEATAQPTIKLRNLERAPGDGYRLQTDANGKPFWILNVGDDVNVSLTPIGFVPTTSGNSSNLNEVVTDPNGDIWIIDSAGDALKVGSTTVFSGGWDDLSGVPADFSDGVDNTLDGDGDSTNEIQESDEVTLSNPIAVNDIIYYNVQDAIQAIINAGVGDGSGFSGDFSDLTNVPADFSDGIDNVDDADANATNEIQTITIDSTGSQFTITLSNGGGSIVFEDTEGAGTDDQTATEVPIADAADNFVTDDVESALLELATNQDAADQIAGSLVNLSGVPVASDDLGTFTEDIITDNPTTKLALQDLETSLSSVIDSSKVTRLSYTDVAIDTTAFALFTGAIDVTITDNVTQDYAITLPNPLFSGIKQKFVINSTNLDREYHYYIETSDTLYARLRVNGYPAERYYLEDETVTITWVNNKWEIFSGRKVDHIADGLDYFNSHLFDIGDKITIGKTGKEYVIKSTTYEEVDSFSVIKVKQKVLYPQNLLANSNKTIKTVLDNGWSWTDGLIEPLGNTDDVRGPTGEKDAIRLIMLASSTNNISYTQDFTYPGHTIGDSLTLSFYYRKRKPGSTVNANIRIADRTGANWLPDEILSSDFESYWKFYKLNFNDREGQDPDNQIKIFPDDALAGDTIYIARPMVHLGWEKSRYINSGDDANFYGTDNYVYAVATNIEEKAVSRNYPSDVDDRVSVFIRDRSYYLEELNIDPNEDIVPYLDQAVEYCQTYNACDRIVLPRNCSHLTQFVAPDGFTISGGDYGQNSINVAPTDSTLILNTTDPDGDYSRGITFENLGYNVTTRTNTVIETNRSLDFHFENVAIDGNDLTDIGVRWGSESISGALSTTSNLLTIRECGVGLQLLNTGNNHTVESGGLNNNNINLQVDISSNVKLLQGTNLESSDSLALDIIEANAVTIDGGYFEQGLMRIANCKAFSLINTYVSGSLDSIFTDNIGYLNITTSRLAGGFNIMGGDNLKGMNLQGNFFQTENDLNGIHTKFFPRKGFVSTGNYGDDFFQVHDYFGKPDYAVTDATYLQGTVTLNNASFRSIIQNLVQNSDSIMIEDGSYDYYDVANDVEASPVYPDSTTMDRITITADWDGDGDPGLQELYLPVHQEIEDVLDIGDEVTVSQWLMATSDSSSYLLLRYRLHPGNLLSVKFPADGQLHKVVLSIDSLEQEVTGLQLGIFQAKTGDVLTMGHMQLVEGLEPLIETYTGETGIDSVGPAIMKGDFVFEGDVEFTGTSAGEVSTTTDASGDVVVTHNLGFTPTNIQVTPISNSWLAATVVDGSVNSSSFTLRFYSESTMVISAANSTAVKFYWSAE